MEDLSTESLINFESHRSRSALADSHNINDLGLGMKRAPHGFHDDETSNVRF